MRFLFEKLGTVEEIHLLSDVKSEWLYQLPQSLTQINMFQ